MISAFGLLLGIAGKYLLHVADQVVVVVEVFNIDAGGRYHAVNQLRVVSVLRSGGDALGIDGIEPAESGQFDVLANPTLLHLLGREGGVSQSLHLVNGEHVARVTVFGSAVVGKTQLVNGPGADDGEARKGEEPHDDVQRFAPKAAPAPVLERYAKFRSHSTFSKSVTSINTKTIAPAR